MRRAVTTLLALAFCLLVATSARASRTLSPEAVLDIKKAPGGMVEDPCGIARSPSGQIYLSAYYAHAVEVFSPVGEYQSSLAAGVPPEGPCQLATSSSGVLYANLWHEGVERILPSRLPLDGAESTGVAVDVSGRVYANDRTYVAVYEPSGDPVGGKATPLLLGEGSLGDSYGLAVWDGHVFVADVASNTIKVFEADGSPGGVVAEIDGSAIPKGHFVYLTDASLAIDPTNGHLLVMDNTQPGFAHPQGAIYEFSSAGAYLEQLPGAPIDGGPSGMAFKPDGTLLVTSGNSEEGTVLSYSPYSAGGSPVSGEVGGAVSAVSAQLSSGFSGGASQSPSARAGESAPASASETIQRGRVRVGVDASLTPQKLPRKGAAPVHFTLAATISPTKGSVPPQLQRIEIEINRHGRIEPKGLPNCELDQIQPSTTQAALEACRSSLVGTGKFSAKVLISQQAPFPSDGEVYAFNGTYKGRPAILAHIYGSKPIPTSATIPFVIGRAKGNTYGTKLTASLPQATSKWGYVTGISMELGKSFTSHGKKRSFLSAGCPAPKGFSRASFPLSRTSFAFAGGKKVSSVLNRSCRAG